MNEFLDKEGLGHYTARVKQLVNEKSPSPITTDQIDMMIAVNDGELLFANSIEECTDTSKQYVLPDGYIYAYNEETGEWASTGVSYEDNTEEAGNANIDVTATVGQTIIVKAVDENGKPTEWEAVDHQPRTHWVEGGKVEVPLDGEWAEDSPGAFVYYFATVPDLKAGATCIVNWDGTEYVCTANEIDMEGLPAIIFGNGAVLGLDDTGEPFGYLGCALAGIAMLTATDCSNEHTFTICANSEVVHKMDEKFLPVKHKRYILEYAASDLTSSGENTFVASEEKQTEVLNLIAELSTLDTINMNMSVAVPNMGEVMRLPVFFNPKNVALGTDGNIAAVSFDGRFKFVDEVYGETSSALLGSISIYKNGMMVDPADNYQAIAMLGVKITIDVLHL